MNMNRPSPIANPGVFPFESGHGHDGAVDDSYSVWKGWCAADFGLVNSEEALYFERELQATGIAQPAGLRVGEIGYGNGSFAGWARRGGAQWIGRETSQVLQARAVEAGFEILTPEASLSDTWGGGALDLIVAFDVVEHMSLSAVRSFLAEAKAALKPGGLLLLRTPSGDSPFVSAIYCGDVTHRTLLRLERCTATRMRTGPGNKADPFTSAADNRSLEDATGSPSSCPICPVDCVLLHSNRPDGQRERHPQSQHDRGSGAKAWRGGSRLSAAQPAWRRCAKSCARN